MATQMTRFVSFTNTAESTLPEDALSIEQLDQVVGGNPLVMGAALVLTGAAGVLTGAAVVGAGVIVGAAIGYATSGVVAGPDGRGCTEYPSGPDFRL